MGAIAFKITHHKENNNNNSHKMNKEDANLIDRQKVISLCESIHLMSTLRILPNPSQFHQVCPFLLRIFLNGGRHHPISDYANRRTPPASDELQIYTWLDASLSEVMGLIRETPEYRAKGTQFSFSVVFPEPSAPSYRMRSIGLTIGGKRGPEDNLTLAQCRYQIGDYIDVAILPPGADASRLNLNQQANKKGNIQRNRGDGGGVGGRLQTNAWKRNHGRRPT